MSEATWTLALSGKDIKQKAQFLLAFQRLAQDQGGTFNLDLQLGMPAEYVPEWEFLDTRFSGAC
jgi:hypothetical protein